VARIVASSADALTDACSSSVILSEMDGTMSANEFGLSESPATSSRERFEAYIYETFAGEIRSWDEATRDDIYAVSFFVYDYEDDPRQPEVYLSYNTLTYWQERVERGADPGEAKWNFALWPQDFKAIIATPDGEGYVGPDTEGRALRNVWLASEGMDYVDEELDSPEAHERGRDIAQTFDLMQRWQDMTQSFVALCVRSARRLHESGVIADAFGRTVPIIVHELEYYDEILAQTRDANPPGATVEFERYWVDAVARFAHP